MRLARRPLVAAPLLLAGGTAVRAPALGRRGAFAFAAVGAVAALVYLPGFGRGPLLHGPGQLALPRRVPSPVAHRAAAAGFAYWVPSSGGLCWATPVPCSLRPVPPDRRLRDPAAGIPAGFVTVE